MYNLLTIVKTTEKGRETKKKIEKIVRRFAKVVKSNEIGERELAYPIGKETKGFYFWLDFELDKDKLPRLREELEKTKPIRYLIVDKPKLKPVKRKKTAKKRVKKIEKPKPKKLTLSKKKGKKKEKTVKKDLASEKKRMEDLEKKLEEIL